MKALEMDQLEFLEGGQTAVQIVDGVCASVAIWGAFGGPVGWGTGLFCAGWGVGRILSS
ncbi:MAG: hypothetical protein ABJK11_12590 [Balneola sp.]